MFLSVQAIKLNLTGGHDGDGEIGDGLTENPLLLHGVGVGVGVGVRVGGGGGGCIGGGGGSGPHQDALGGGVAVGLQQLLVFGACQRQQGPQAAGVPTLDQLLQQLAERDHGSRASALLDIFLT